LRTAGSGQTPLMNAVLSGKGSAVKYLLKKGADVTIAEKDGYTPMHGAGEHCTHRSHSTGRLWPAKPCRIDL
jgi:hypothetical protein